MSYPKLIKEEKPAERRLVEHFLILGAPYSDYSEIVPFPEILNIFPYAPLLLEPTGIHQLTSFCYPQGLHPLSEKEKKKKDPILDFFIFRIGGTDIPYYGVCAKVQVKCFKKLPFFATSSSSNFPFIFCIVTSIPIFSTHFQFLSFIANSLFSRKTIKLVLPGVEELPVQKGATLPSLDTKNGIGTCPKINPSKTFFKQVNLYRSINQNTKEPLIFPITDRINLSVPIVSQEAKTIAQCCLDLLFSLLPVTDIISIYASALVGNYVIFKSSNPRYVSFCVLGLCSLIFPFPLHMPILPIIPNDPKFIRILNSPVPYIAGVLDSADLDDIEIDATATIINLDECVIENQVPIDVPYKEDQIKYITTILEEEKNDILVPQKTTKENLFAQPKPNPLYDEFFETKIDPFSIPKHFYLEHQQKYIFNEKTIDKILVVFSQRIGPWLSLVKEEIQQLAKM